MNVSSPSRMKLPSPPRVADRRPIAAGALIAWIAVSPWVWGFSGAHPAVANHVFLVLGFGPIAVMIAALRPAAIVTIGGGLWLALSPWILGYAGDHVAWVNELLTGGLLSLLAANAAGLTGLGRVRLRRPRGGQRRRTQAAVDQ
ncbi:MAG TPA: SPW repeat protein [Solirubrobacteraceae bacterium]|nr:SPW repeat protein [Solirubrobacteraceae bacterium]